MAQRVVVHADQHDLDRHRTNLGAVSWRQAHPANAFLWDGGRGGDHSALLPSMALSGLGASGCHVGFGPGHKPHDDDVQPSLTVCYTIHRVAYRTIHWQRGDHGLLGGARWCVSHGSRRH